MPKTEDEIMQDMHADYKLRGKFGIPKFQLTVAQLGEASRDDDQDVRRAAFRELGSRSHDGEARALLEAAATSGENIQRDGAEVALSTPAQLLDKLSAELIEIGEREGYVGSPGSDYDEHWNHKRARRIGIELNDSGGLELMRKAHSLVQTRFGGTPRARELEACWGGVGTWQR